MLTDLSDLKARILVASRQERRQIIHQYADLIYANLTDNFTQHYRLSELVYRAAELFPKLVPTRLEIESEREHLQSQKKGLEIDQGIFLRALLRSPAVALHLANAMRLPCSRAINLLTDFQRTNQINLGTIFLERCDEAAYLTINNQHCLNAEDNRLVDDMETAVDLALLDNRVKVCVLRGGVMTHPRYLGKRVFCSGLNLIDLHAGKISFVDFLLRREFGYISKIAHGLLTTAESIDDGTGPIQKPWIAAVDSFAIGGGMQLLLVFDKVIAADDAYFSLPAAQEGIIPGAANFRLSRIVGHRMARQIILSGRKIFATDPQAHYVCDEIVSSAQIDAAIAAAVSELNNPAVVENRRMLNFAEESQESFCRYMAEFSYAQVMRLYSSDVLAKIDRWANRAGRRENVKASGKELPCC